MEAPRLLPNAANMRSPPLVQAVPISFAASASITVRDDLFKAAFSTLFSVSRPSFIAFLNVSYLTLSSSAVSLLVYPSFNICCAFSITVSSITLPPLQPPFFLKNPSIPSSLNLFTPRITLLFDTPNVLMISTWRHAPVLIN
jgi:hypothetical protein